jgi:tetratricopeptide (TPR) repeat protein
MSASDGQAPASRNRQRKSFVIRREDHIGDPIGLVFLESPETQPDAVLERLGAYLGVKIKLLKAEVGHDEITVEVEARGWPEEGARMAAAARDLHRKGGRKAALTMYRDAVDLDPVNTDAVLGLGLAMAEQDKFADALTMLKRARELGATGTELLLAMGRCAAQLDRSATAIGYYEQVLKIVPRNFIARRALRALGKDPAPVTKAATGTRTSRE